MQIKTLGLIAAAALATSGIATAANAANLTAGIYISEGYVTQSNSACNAVGLAQGAGVFNVLKFPGSGKSGLTLYTPALGVLQLCSGFAAVPAGGLNGFSSSANCATYQPNLPSEPVNFSFTSQVTDANSGVGTTTVNIPVTDPVGGGCQATINTAIVRSGK